MTMLPKKEEVRVQYIPYDEDEVDFITKKVTRRYAYGGNIVMMPGQDQMGYGAKITTDLMAVIHGRKYRVYCTCFSNAASHWIMKDGVKLHIRSSTAWGET